MKIFQADSPLMAFLSRLGDLIILNILWLLGCLPVLTAGASTVALYYCLFHLDGEKLSGGLFRWFFSAFKSNFLRSVPLLLIYLAATALAAVNVWYYLTSQDIGLVWRLVLMLPALLVLLAASYLFPLQARYENTFFATLKNTVKLTLLHLPTTLAVTALNWLPVILFFVSFPLLVRTALLWTLFGFALMAYLNAFLLKRVFAKHMPQPEAESETQEP